jgi:hypothetical protein
VARALIAGAAVDLHNFNVLFRTLTDVLAERGLITYAVAAA